jgi:outer membrane receptor protein involved in Fe transport
MAGLCPLETPLPFKTLPASHAVVAAALSLACLAGAARAQAADPDGDDPTRPVTELVVTARRLDAARSNVDPALGATSYSLTAETIESRPGNEAISLSKVLQQFPGVQGDGSGQLRVRQSQGDLQYRINDVIIPEGPSDLGESLSARIAQKITVVTGALPAQYGFQSAGVVSITTKSGAYLDGGQLEGYGGGRGEGEGAFELGLSSGPSNLFASGSFHRNPIGRPAPDGSRDPLHDRSDQSDAFVYADRIIDDRTRVALILGASDDRFQVPNVRGRSSALFADPEATYRGPLALAGLTSARSEDLDDRHREATRFGVASLMRTDEKLTVQVAAFLRESAVAERANADADLLLKGIGLSSDELSQAHGLQAEAVYEVASDHTLRAGLQLAWERQKSTALVRALPVDATGRQSSLAPLPFADGAALAQRKLSVFLQDEWRLTSDLTLNLGGRLDRVRQTGMEETAFSPRASLVWIMPNGATAHLGYARYVLPAPLESAGEAPTDLAGTTAATPGLAGGGLRSERDDYLDVGVQQTWDHLTLGVDAYHRQARDLIAEGEFGPGNLARAFNYRRGRLMGVELSATYDDGPLSAWGNLAVARGRGREVVSNQFYFTPRQLAELAAGDTALREDQRVTATTGGAYRLGRMKASGSLIFGSGLPRTPPGAPTNSDHLAPYAQLDLSLDYRLGRERPLMLRLDLINVADARYRLRDATGLGDGLPLWGPRRGVFLGLEQTF